MANQADLDQGGTFRETTRVYQGPSLGWSQQVAAPPVSAITVTAPGTTVLQPGVSTVHVNVNAAVTIQLYAAKGNAAGAGQVPGSFVQVTLTVNDIGGFASTFPITILPAAGETIGGSTSVTIAANYGLFVLLSDVQNGGWTVASGVSGTAVADAPSDGSTYGRLNATWAKVLPLIGGTLTGPLATPSLAVSGNGTVSGILSAPTAAVGTNTTQVASTAFVLAQLAAFGLRGYLSGLTLSTAGSSSTFSAAAGIATDSTFAGMITLAASINKTTGAWAVGSGNGSLDTGVIANNTWYHVYVITRLDTGVVDVLISLSASAPTMPSSYTRMRRIGSMRTDGSGNWILFRQLGDEFLWATTILDANTIALNAGARTLVALTVPTGVQVNALTRITVTGTANTVIITSPDETDQASSGTGAGVSVRTTAAADAGSAAFSTRTNTLGQIGIRSSVAGNFFISTYGWIDRRGRDA